MLFSLSSLSHFALAGGVNAPYTLVTQCNLDDGYVLDRTARKLQFCFPVEECTEDDIADIQQILVDQFNSDPPEGSEDCTYSLGDPESSPSTPVPAPTIGDLSTSPPDQTPVSPPTSEPVPFPTGSGPTPTITVSPSCIIETDQLLSDPNLIAARDKVSAEYNQAILKNISEYCTPSRTILICEIDYLILSSISEYESACVNGMCVSCQCELTCIHTHTCWLNSCLHSESVPSRRYLCSI